MKIIKKIFGQKDTSDQSAKVTELTGNAEARCAQLKGNDDINLLLTAYQTENDEVVIDCADRRLREVLIHTKDKNHLIAVDSVQLSLKTLKTLAATAKSPQLRRSSLDKIHDDQSLTEVIAHSEDWQIKIAAIEQLNDMDTLRSLQKQFKGKQKNGYRSVKKRLVTLRQREGDIAVLSQSMNLLEAAIKEQTLSASQMTRTLQQWQAVKDFLPTRKRQDFSQVLEMAQGVSRHNEQARETRQHLLDELDGLRQQLSADIYNGDKAAFEQEISDLQSLWAQLPEWHSNESEAMGARFGQAVGYINEQAAHYFNEQYSTHSQQRLLEMCRQRLANNTFVTEDIIANKTLRWQELPPLQDREAQSRYQEAFDDLIEQLKNRSQQQKVERHNNDKQVPQLLEQLETLIENGEVQAATEIQNDVRKRLRSPVGLSKGVHQQVSGAFKRLEDRLHELVEWQRFGDGQVRENLIEALQALCDDSDMAVEEKAEKVKSLQKQWKDLGGRAPNSMWKRFKSLGDEAWQPCAEHFKTLREASEQHLQERLRFLQETDEYLDGVDWQQADWARLIEARQLFEQQWKAFPKLHDSDYRKAKKIYRKVTKKWDKQFNAERLRELQRREQAIATVQQLVDSNKAETAIAQTQALQQAWTPSVALKKPSEENALREQFQQACEAVFERHLKHRDEALQQQTAEPEECEQQLAILRSQDMLCIQLETEFRTNMRLKQIEQTWQTLTPPLSDEQTAINERFQQALEAQQSGTLPVADEKTLAQAEAICLLLELGAGLLSVEAAENARETLRRATVDGLEALRVPEAPAAVSELDGADSKVADDADTATDTAEAFAHQAARLYRLNARWLALPKSGLNETNGVSLLAWRARFERAMQKNRAALPQP